MASEYIYKLTQKAEQDLDDIVRYIAEELSNPTAAAKFINEFTKAVDEACRFPDSGSKVINKYLKNQNVRMKIIGNYLLYYLPDYEKRIIYVVRIVYGYRDLNEILRDIVN